MSFHRGLFTRLTAVAVMALGTMLGLSNTTRAATIPFDPDGAADGFINIDNLDFTPGNSLFQALGPLTVDHASASQLYIQARVGNLNNDGLGDVTPAALNTLYELTMYMEVPVTATVAGDTTTYSIAAGPSVFELWYDANPITQSDDLAGTGFRSGTLILNGLLASADGSFTDLTSFLGTDDFDQFGVDDYGGFQTHQVVGGGAFDVSILAANPGFFGIVPPQLQFLLSNTSTVTPFTTSNPSQLFGGVVAPVLGNVNGQGPDFQALADSTASFTVVPEPSAWMLLSVAALAGLAWGRRS